MKLNQSEEKGITSGSEDLHVEASSGIQDNPDVKAGNSIYDTPLIGKAKDFISDISLIDKTDEGDRLSLFNFITDEKTSNIEVESTEENLTIDTIEDAFEDILNEELLIDRWEEALALEEKQESHDLEEEQSRSVESLIKERSYEEEEEESYDSADLEEERNRPVENLTKERESYEKKQKKSSNSADLKEEQSKPAENLTKERKSHEEEQKKSYNSADLEEEQNRFIENLIEERESYLSKLKTSLSNNIFDETCFENLNSLIKNYYSFLTESKKDYHPSLQDKLKKMEEEYIESFGWIAKAFPQQEGVISGQILEELISSTKRIFAAYPDYPYSLSFLLLASFSLDLFKVNRNKLRLNERERVKETAKYLELIVQLRLQKVKNGPTKFLNYMRLLETGIVICNEEFNKMSKLASQIKRDLSFAQEMNLCSQQLRDQLNHRLAQIEPWKEMYDRIRNLDVARESNLAFFRNKSSNQNYFKQLEFFIGLYRNFLEKDYPKLIAKKNDMPFAMYRRLERIKDNFYTDLLDIEMFFHKAKPENLVEKELRVIEEYKEESQVENYQEYKKEEPRSTGKHLNLMNMDRIENALAKIKRFKEEAFQSNFTENQPIKKRTSKSSRLKQWLEKIFPRWYLRRKSKQKDLLKREIETNFEHIKSQRKQWIEQHVINMPLTDLDIDENYYKENMKAFYLFDQMSGFVLQSLNGCWNQARTLELKSLYKVLSAFQNIYFTEFSGGDHDPKAELRNLFTRLQDLQDSIDWQCHNLKNKFWFTQSKLAKSYEEILSQLSGKIRSFKANFPQIFQSSEPEEIISGNITPNIDPGVDQKVDQVIDQRIEDQNSSRKQTSFRKISEQFYSFHTDSSKSTFFSCNGEESLPEENNLDLNHSIKAPGP